MRSPLKRLVSWAAGLYPNTFFYGAELHTKYNGMLEREKSTGDGEKMGPLAQAALMMSIAAGERMKPGDVLEASFGSTQYSGEERGSFKVTVERIG